MPCPTLLLVMLLALNSAKSIVVEFQPSKFPSDDLDIFWQYYGNGGDINHKAYIDIPKATITLSHVKLNGEEFLSFDGTFKNGIGHVYVNRKGTFYKSSQKIGKDGKLEKINADTQLGYIQDKDIIKDESYIAIRYQSLEETQKGLDDVNKDNEKYYSLPALRIIPGLVGQFIQRTDNPLIQSTHLSIRVLSGSTSEDGSVVTITGAATSDTFFSFESPSKKYVIDDKNKSLKEVLGIRLADYGVSEVRKIPNKAGLSNNAHVQSHDVWELLRIFRCPPYEHKCAVNYDSNESDEYPYYDSDYLD